MSNTLYVPILKWKKGEQEALKKLSLEHKNKIMQLIEIIDYEEPKNILNSLENCYPNPLFIDTIIAAETEWIESSPLTFTPFQSLIGRLKTRLKELRDKKKQLFQSLIGRLKTLKMLIIISL